MSYEAIKQHIRNKSQNLCKYEPNVNKQTGESKFYEWHKSDKTLRAIFGGNRTGKTESGGFEDVCAVMGDLLKPYLSLMTPQGREIAEKWIKIGAQSGWVCSVSFGLQPEGVQKKILHYLPKECIKDISYLRRNENIISKITLVNDKYINFKSYEQSPEDFQSAGIGWIHFDEEPPRNIWQEANMRQEAGITLYKWLTMTPVKGMTWVYKEIYQNCLDNPNIFKITVGWDDNPHLTEDQIKQMSAGLTEEELQMRRDGKFVKKQGLVYKTFNQSIHLKDIELDPNRFTFYRSFDFGFAEDHPFVALFYAVDTDGTVYCYDELYLRETAQDETINLVKQKSQPFSFRGSWGDSARPDWIDSFNKKGIGTIQAIKDVEAGIAKVTEYLAVHPVSKKPKLFISNKCQQLISELEMYSYEQIDDGDQGKRLPEKRYDNGPDALRYFLYSFTKPAQQRKRIIGYQGRDPITGYGGTPIYG